MSNTQLKGYGSVAVVNSKIRKMKDTVHVVTVMAGEMAKLPCNIKEDNEDDRMKLVLWFRNTSDTPFYTYDAVNPKSPPLHWRDPDAQISFRSEFEPHPSTSVLIIKKTQLEDSGRYKCRVDYFLEQTTFQLMDLVVILPPQKPKIYLDNGLSVAERLVVKENQSLSLTCESVGGSPLPELTWWKDHQKLDNSYEKLQNKVVNKLVLENLGRKDLNSILNCKAINNNISNIVYTSLHLDMALPPLTVNILDKSKIPIAGQNQTIECEVSGSSPEPLITWWKDQTELAGATTQTSEDGNLTLSSIFFTPKISHTGSVITCLAETPGLRIQKTDSWNLTVHYSPMPKLKLGDTLNRSNIREDDDVYFECRVRSYPPVKAIIWKHNGRRLKGDKNGGIIISGNSLAIQKIKREFGGNYSCTASNDVSKVESNLINLDVKYTPACAQGQQQIYEAAKLQEIQISCYMNANPQDNIDFSWSFNNSANLMDIPKGDVKSAGLSSRISYTPRTELDFGTLLCWGENTIGKGTPCMFSILPIGPPDPPSRCMASNVTYSSFKVSCDESSDNTNQFYSMEVKLATGKSIHKLENRSSHFQVVGLVSGTTYKVTVISQNKHGKSDPVYMLIETLMEPIKQIAETKIKEDDSDENQILAIILGVFITIMLIVIMVTLAMITFRLRMRLQRHTSSPIVNTSLLQDRRHPDVLPKREGKPRKGSASQPSPSSPYITYCRTISSDVEDYITDGYHDLSTTQKIRSIDYRKVKKNNDKYVPITSSCDSSISLVDCGRSPLTSDKVIHTPPPQYRGTPISGEEGESCLVKSPSVSHKESII